MFIVLFFLLFFALFPFYWMVMTSFTSVADLYKGVSYFPRNPTISEYSRLFRESRIEEWYSNSLSVTGITFILAIPISFFAAYSLVKIRWPFRNILGALVLVGYLIPESVLVVPLYTVLSNLGLVNTHIGLVLAYLTYCTPFCTWLLMGYLEGIPDELENAAMLDGCGRFSLLFRIILPLSAPGIISAGIFGFVTSWSLFLYPAVLISSNQNQLLVTGIPALVGGDVYPWGMLMGAGVLVCIAPIVLFVFVQRYVVQGLTAGAIK